MRRILPREQYLHFWTLILCLPTAPSQVRESRGKVATVEAALQASQKRVAQVEADLQAVQRQAAQAEAAHQQSEAALRQELVRFWCSTRSPGINRT